MDDSCANRDLVCSSWACLFWCLPAAMLAAGYYWPAGRVWLWVPALAVAGGACVVNAGRCGRLHCYITGPLFLLAAVYVALAEFHIFPLEPQRFLLIVFALSVAAYLMELPLGKYTKKAGAVR